MNPAVDFYFAKAQRWQPEIEQLRQIVLGCGLTEELKWGVPGYTVEKRNVALIHVFKEYCALLFIKGALLSDPHGLLVQQTANTQAARQLRFTSLTEIVEREAVIQAYLHEAVALEKAGAKVEFKKTAELSLPEEFQQRLVGDAALQSAFYALTPGRQRAYILHFGTPKQANTRHSRVEQCVARILSGKGLHD